MKLRMYGDASQPGGVQVFMVGNEGRTEIRTATRVVIDTEGARVEAYIPEIDAEIVIPDAMANALLDLERLRVVIAERDSKIDDLRAQVTELERILDASDRGLEDAGR